MGFLEVSAVLVSLAALLSLINHKLLRMPATIGLMLLAFVLASGLLVGASQYPSVDDAVHALVGAIDFNDTLMHGMLGFLLFAGALHVQLSDLRQQTWLVLVLATVGVVATTALVGGAMYVTVQVLGLRLDLIYCLLFGSLIAPTDPIAVLAIMKKVGAPRAIETKLAGESLFNDGVGVVVFLALLSFVAPNHDPHATGGPAEIADPPALITDLATPPQKDIPDITALVESTRDTRASAVTVGPRKPPEPGSAKTPSVPETSPAPGQLAADTRPAPGFGHDAVADGGLDGPKIRDFVTLFTFEAGGGLLLGGLLGGLAFLLLRTCDAYQTEILITLALVFGGYTLAQHLHVSGPLAMVVAGLLIGNPGRSRAMSKHTREHLDNFWELIDFILNAVLFVLIGLEVVVLSLRGDYLLAGVLAVPVVLLCRFIAVGGAVAVLRQFRPFSPHTVKVMTWAGLRGGISLAMALALKEKAVDDPAAGELVLTVTYVVVACSIVIQGLTVGPLLRVCGLANRHDPYAE